MRYINVFYNPGFEGDLDYWTPNGWYSGNTIEVIADEGVSGDCIKLTVPAELGQSSVKQTVALDPGEHTVSFYAKRIHGNADVWVEVKINGVVQYSPSFSSQLSSTYTQLNYTFTVEGTERTDVEIRFIAGSVEGAVYFDSMCLYIDDAIQSDTPTEIPGVFNGQVINGALNMRASCSTSSSRLTQIPNGTAIVVEIVDGQNEWFATTYNGYEGYVMAQYVAITEGGGECTPNVSSSLNVRKKPVSGATRLYLAYPGDSLRLLDCTSVEGWCRVSSAQGTGWSDADYVTILSYPETSTPDPEEPDVPVDPDDPDDPVDPAIPTIPAPSVILTDTLQLGDYGSQVTALQQRLVELWYYPGDNVGEFDYDTEWAVRYFKKQNGLAYDGVNGGIVDAATRAKLNSTSVTRGVADHLYNYHTGTAPHQWYMNGIEAPWRNEAFDAEGTTNKTETIGDSGNCPTSFAMIASTLTHSAITPAHVCSFVKSFGYRDETGNNGITSGFFAAAAEHYGLNYHNTVNGIDAIIDQLALDRLALVRIVGNADHGYCGADGATYLVVYSVGDGCVYVANPNYNTRDQDELSYTQWLGKSWVKEAHIYSI